MEIPDQGLYSGEKYRILIVDDDETVRALFRKSLQKSGLDVFSASNSAEALKLIQKYSFHGIILDQEIGDCFGTDLVPDIFKISPFSKIVFLTTAESIPLVKEALFLGADDFLLKKDPIQFNIEKLLSLLKRESPQRFDDISHHADIIGSSNATRSILFNIDRLKSSSTTVLLTGESGVGKEMFARAIHNNSGRSSKPFLAINCAAISENLLEAELFGYKKGAFTDAKTDRKGYFQECSGGTLLLDEIGEMNLGLQAKLLRVLQEKEVTPLGNCKPIKIDTRIIAATNRNLKEEIKKKTFREDLYYRLAVINIHVPPLRDRLEDIEELVKYFVKKLNQQLHRDVKPPGNDIISRLKCYSWPGNIRELYNAVERGILLSENDKMNIEDLLPLRELVSDKKNNSSGFASLPLDYSEAKNSFEKQYLQNLLKAVNYNIAEASRVSSQYRTNIYRLIKKHNIIIPEKKHS